MADLRFNIDKAIERLHTERVYCENRIKETAANCESELRAVDGVLAGDGPKWDVSGAAAFHVFDGQFYQEVREGGELELAIYGQRLGRSVVSRAIKPGRYRAIVQLTRLPDEEPPR